MASKTYKKENNMVVNLYAGILPGIKEQIKDRFPVIYERCIKPIRLKMIDRKRRPMIQGAINKIISTRPFPLFDYVEIETVNRCNNTCTFCPVNRNVDTRPFKLMDEQLFISIIKQLQEIGYSGKIGLFSNNEPLLDNRIFEFARITKETLPHAHLFIMTNGLLLTIEKLELLMGHLDKLIIDNYEDNLNLTQPAQEIYNYCLKNKVYQGKIKIWLRKKDEILTNRAGQAKNRSKIKPLRSSCVYPFAQLIIRPDGKVSLCCNDALGQMTMGDLTKEKIIDVWNGETFRQTREKLLNGRKYVSLCSLCDSGGL